MKIEESSNPKWVEKLDLMLKKIEKEKVKPSQGLANEECKDS